MEKRSLRIKIRQAWAKWWGWILFALVLVVIVALLVVLVWTGIIETGFGEYTPPTSDTERAKTLWDWMDLLLVPLLLALGAWLLNRSARTREHEAEDRRAAEQRKIEVDRARETALQIYLDRMTELLRDGLRESELGDERRSIARARTMTTLRQLDGERKGLLLQFLYESGLVRKSTGEEEPQLALVDLRGADLRGADLKLANLRGADLHRTDLSEADLSWANLTGADLREANLRGANLRGADLRGAEVTDRQLAQAEALEEAILPSGAKYTGKLSLNLPHQNRSSKTPRMIDHEARR